MALLFLLGFILFRFNFARMEFCVLVASQISVNVSPHIVIFGCRFAVFWYMASWSDRVYNVVITSLIGFCMK